MVKPISGITRITGHSTRESCNGRVEAALDGMLAPLYEMNETKRDRRHGIAGSTDHPYTRRQDITGLSPQRPPGEWAAWSHFIETWEGWWFSPVQGMQVWTTGADKGSPRSP